jgi:hypothetical protein
MPAAADEAMLQEWSNLIIKNESFAPVADKEFHQYRQDGAQLIYGHLFLLPH